MHNTASGSTVKKIDAHQHFWKYDPEQFGWIDDTMRQIRRDFLPQDSQQTVAGAGVAGVVSVQSRQSIGESEWLLGLAEQHSFILGVVGWVPLTDPKVEQHLESLCQSPKFKGVRHILQTEPDTRFMLREDFNRGVSRLRRFGLTYDILVFEHHLPQAVEFIHRHPDQVFVLDHLGKPRVKDGFISPWREQIGELAGRENVYCKLSGLVTEADYKNWTAEQLWPYMEVVLESFGPERLMFGSDWPVCLVATSYERWKETVSVFVSNLSSHEQERIWRGTAAEVYKLDVS